MIKHKEVLKQLKKRKYSLQQIANKFGVSRQSIWYIHNKYSSTPYFHLPIATFNRDEFLGDLTIMKLNRRELSQKYKMSIERVMYYSKTMTGSYPFVKNCSVCNRRAVKQYKIVVREFEGKKYCSVCLSDLLFKKYEEQS